MANPLVCIFNPITTLIDQVQSQSTFTSAAAAGAPVVLNLLGRLDPSLLGQGISATAGELLVAGALVNLYNNGGNLYMQNAYAGTVGTPPSGGSYPKAAVGFTANNTSITNSGLILFTGTFTYADPNSEFSVADIGKEIYLSTVTPGGVTKTAPSGVGQLVQSCGNVVGFTAPNFVLVSFVASPQPPTSSPGGIATNLQFNNSGVFGGLPGSAVDGTNGLLTLAPSGTGVALTITGDNLNAHDILDLKSNGASYSAVQFRGGFGPDNAAIQMTLQDTMSGSFINFIPGSTANFFGALVSINPSSIATGIGLQVFGDNSGSNDIAQFNKFGGTPAVEIDTHGNLILHNALIDGSASPGVSGYVLSSTVTGTQWIPAGATSTPGGSNSAIQFNNSGVFGGTTSPLSSSHPQFTFNPSIPAAPTFNMSATGTVQAEWTAGIGGTFTQLEMFLNTSGPSLLGITDTNNNFFQWQGSSTGANSSFIQISSQGTTSVTIDPIVGSTYGTPTGGAKGVGTINAQGLYVNNVPVSTTSATPGGAPTNIQYNLAGAFAGIPGSSVTTNGGVGIAPTGLDIALIVTGESTGADDVAQFLGSVAGGSGVTRITQAGSINVTVNPAFFPAFVANGQSFMSAAAYPTTTPLLITGDSNGASPIFQVFEQFPVNIEVVRINERGHLTVEPQGLVGTQTNATFTAVGDSNNNNIQELWAYNGGTLVLTDTTDQYGAVLVAPVTGGANAAVRVTGDGTNPVFKGTDSGTDSFTVQVIPGSTSFALADGVGESITGSVVAGTTQLVVVNSNGDEVSILTATGQANVAIFNGAGAAATLSCPSSNIPTLSMSSPAAAGNLTLQVNGANPTVTFFYGASGTNGVVVQPSPSSTAWALTLPLNAGSTGFVLQTDGTGVTTWKSPYGSVVTKTTTYTATSTDHTINCNGTFTLTLPTVGIQVGQEYYIKNIGTGVITVSSSVNIDGSLTQVLNTQYQSITVQWDGTQYWIY